MAPQITYNAPIVKKVVLLVMFALQLVCPALADQAYGRFGRFHEDGLLTTNVHPRGFTLLGTNPELNIRWGDPKAPLSAVVNSINPTEKILAIDGGGVGAPSSIRYTLVYPGFSATFGKQLVLRFSNRAGKAVRVGLDPTRLKQGWLLVIPADRYPAVPLLIKVPRSPQTKAWFTGDGLTVESPSPLGEVIFTTPTGLRPVASLNAAWKAVSDWGDAPIPVLQAISNEKSATEITTTQTWNTPYAPISPILALALQAGFPARVPGPLVRTEIRTRYGPYAYVAAKSASISHPVPKQAVPVLYGEGMAIPAGNLAAPAQLTQPTSSLWSLYRWLQSAERLPPPVRTNLIRTYRVRRGKILMLDTSEPITGVHLQLPRSGNEKNKRDLDDVVALARVVLVDHAFVNHISDGASLENLKTSLAALVSAVQVRTDWLWGSVGRSDDGYQSLDARETNDVLAALAIAIQNPDGGLTPGEVDDASVAFLSHCWSAFSREALAKFALQTSQIPANVQLDRLNENGTFDVVSTLQNAKGVQTSQLPFDVPASYLLDNYVSKTGQNGFGRLPDDADIGLLHSDGLRITRVVDTSINRLTIDVTSGSGRLRVLKLVTSERWKAANIRMNESVLFSMQVGDELHILMPPFVGATKLEVQALHSAASSYVFLYPLFGMMDWQNDVSVIGPGSSR
jgi:hypothetical protein